MHDNFMRLGLLDFGRDGPARSPRSFQATLARKISPPRIAATASRSTPGSRCCATPSCRSKHRQGRASKLDRSIGDVSWVVPTVQARGATCAIGTPFHSWQLTGQGKTGYAHKGLVHVAKVMAGTAIDAIRDKDVIARSKEDLRARTQDTPYVCPLPPEVEAPALDMSGGGGTFAKEGSAEDGPGRVGCGSGAAEAIERRLPLNIEAHQSRRDIQAHQPALPPRASRQLRIALVVTGIAVTARPARWPNPCASACRPSHMGR